MPASSAQSSPVALITGGARRIGAAIARRLHSDGFRLVLHCRNSRTEAEELARELGGEAWTSLLCGDLADCDFLANLVSEAAAIHGRLDLLVNNASVYRRMSLEETSIAELQSQFLLNCFGPIELMRRFAQRHQPGCIVNLLDGRIDKCDTGAAAYLLSKQSLADATRAAALEWACYGLRVNGVAPGLVRPADGVPMERMRHLLEAIPLRCRSSEEEIAAAVSYLASMPSVTGEILYVDGGLHLADTAIGERKP